MPKGTLQVCGRAEFQSQAVWLPHLDEDPLERETDKLTQNRAGLVVVAGAENPSSAGAGG